MPAKVALGWSVKNAFVAPNGIVVTNALWTTDYTPASFPAWGWNATITAKSEAMMDAIMPWLADGRRYLALQRAHVTGDPFGSLMEAYVIAAGGTFTRSGTTGSFGAYDWDDFDVICAVSTTNQANADIFDTAIAAGKSALVCVIGASNTFARYGINRSGTLTADGAPNYLARPFDCAPLGLTGHQLVSYGSSKIIDGTNTIGGTITKYNNTVGEGAVSIWTPA